jgi:hypothetical protein
MTPYEELMLSGYVNRNKFRMPEKISGLIDVLTYFGEDRELKIIEVEVPVPGPERIVYITGATQYITGETVYEIIEKEYYVSGELKLDATDRIAVYISGELELDADNRIVVYDLKEVPVYLPGETIYVTGATEIVEKEIYVSGELRLDAEGRIVIRETVEAQIDPQAEYWNNVNPKQDIVYAGRVLKHEVNDQLLSLGNLATIATQYGTNSIPNYYKQVPFDVRQFIRKDDAVLKYFIEKNELKKATHDDTMYAIQNWVMFGSFEYAMSTLNTEINDVIKNPPLPKWLIDMGFTSPLLTGNWDKEFTLQPRPILTTLALAAAGLAGASEIVNVYSPSNAVLTRERVLLYSSDRYAEQDPGHSNRPTNDSYDYWQFPFETLFSGYGDCEDGAILIAALAIAAGIPSYKVRVAAGILGPDNANTGNTHMWCIYLADDGFWRVIDWCNGEDINEGTQTAPVPIVDKQRAHLNKLYNGVWFTFNDEYAWLGAPYWRS